MKHICTVLFTILLVAFMATPDIGNIDAFSIVYGFSFCYFVGNTSQRNTLYLLFLIYPAYSLLGRLFLAWDVPLIWHYTFVGLTSIPALFYLLSLIHTLRRLFKILKFCHFLSSRYRRFLKTFVFQSFHAFLFMYTLYWFFFKFIIDISTPFGFHVYFAYRDFFNIWVSDGTRCLLILLFLLAMVYATLTLCYRWVLRSSCFLISKIKR